MFINLNHVITLCMFTVHVSGRRSSKSDNNWTKNKLLLVIGVGVGVDGVEVDGVEVDGVEVEGVDVVIEYILI